MLAPLAAYSVAEVGDTLSLSLTFLTYKVKIMIILIS